MDPDQIRAQLDSPLVICQCSGGIVTPLIVGRPLGQNIRLVRRLLGDTIQIGEASLQIAIALASLATQQQGLRIFGLLLDQLIEIGQRPIPLA